MYVPGGAGHPQLANSGLPLNEAGFVRVDGSCTVDGYDNVYAIGDVLALQGPEWRAKQGHLAELMVPLPIVGHWLKKAWGYYYRLTKYRKTHWFTWAIRELFSHAPRKVLSAHR